MTRMLIAAITAVCMASSANAAMNRIEKGQQLKKLHKVYLQGVRDGLLAYNRQLETDTSRRGGGKVVFANRGLKSCLRRSRRARKSSQTAQGMAIPQPHPDC